LNSNVTQTHKKIFSVYGQIRTCISRMHDRHISRLCHTPTLIWETFTPTLNITTPPPHLQMPIPLPPLPPTLHPHSHCASFALTFAPSVTKALLPSCVMLLMTSHKPAKMLKLVLTSLVLFLSLWVFSKNFSHPFSWVMLQHWRLNCHLMVSWKPFTIYVFKLFTFSFVCFTFEATNMLIHFSHYSRTKFAHISCFKILDAHELNDFNNIQ
jgi:hypothetical protein